MDAARLYLDSADLGTLAEVLPNPLVYGVTTNPTLLKRAGVAWRDLPGLVEAIVGLGARALHLQVTGETADAMVASGVALAGLGDPERIFIKVPATRAGLLAAARLSADGLGVTTTAVYRPEQALFSARAGATYAAPYLGRLQDGGEDGLGVIGRMQALLDLYAPPSDPAARCQRAFTRGGPQHPEPRRRQPHPAPGALRRACGRSRNRPGGGNFSRGRAELVTHPRRTPL